MNTRRALWASVALALVGVPAAAHMIGAKITDEVRVPPGGSAVFDLPGEEPQTALTTEECEDQAREDDDESCSEGFAMFFRTVGDPGSSARGALEIRDAEGRVVALHLYDLDADGNLGRKIVSIPISDPQPPAEIDPPATRSPLTTRSNRITMIERGDDGKNYVVTYDTDALGRARKEMSRRPAGTPVKTQKEEGVIRGGTIFGNHLQYIVEVETNLSGQKYVVYYERNMLGRKGEEVRRVLAGDPPALAPLAVEKPVKEGALTVTIDRAADNSTVFNGKPGKKDTSFAITKDGKVFVRERDPATECDADNFRECYRFEPVKPQPAPKDMARATGPSVCIGEYEDTCGVEDDDGPAPKAPSGCVGDSNDGCSAAEQEAVPRAPTGCVGAGGDGACGVEEGTPPDPRSACAEGNAGCSVGQDSKPEVIRQTPLNTYADQQPRAQWRADEACERGLDDCYGSGRSEYTVEDVDEDDTDDCTPCFPPAAGDLGPVTACQPCKPGTAQPCDDLTAEQNAACSQQAGTRGEDPYAACRARDTSACGRINAEKQVARGGLLECQPCRAGSAPPPNKLRNYAFHLDGLTPITRYEVVLSKEDLGKLKTVQTGPDPAPSLHLPGGGLIVNVSESTPTKSPEINIVIDPEVIERLNRPSEQHPRPNMTEPLEGGLRTQAVQTCLLPPQKGPTSFRMDRLDLKILRSPASGPVVIAGDEDVSSYRIWDPENPTVHYAHPLFAGPYDYETPEDERRAQEIADRWEGRAGDRNIAIARMDSNNVPWLYRKWATVYDNSAVPASALPPGSVTERSFYDPKAAKRAADCPEDAPVQAETEAVPSKEMPEAALTVAGVVEQTGQLPLGLALCRVVQDTSWVSKIAAAVRPPAPPVVGFLTNPGAAPAWSVSDDGALPVLVSATDRATIDAAIAGAMRHGDAVELVFADQDCNQAKITLAREEITHIAQTGGRK